MSDINVCQRTLKLLHRRICANKTIRSPLAPKVTRIFGIWHPYKYAYQTVHEGKGAVFSSVEYKNFIANLASTMMTWYPKVIMVV